MSHTKRQYENWVFSQEEPLWDSGPAGRKEKQSSSMEDKTRLINEWKEKLGDEEFHRRMEEDKQKEREWYEYENNL